MADLTASVVSAPRLASSTDTVVVRVVSASNAALTGAFDLSLSRSWTDPMAWVAATNNAGVVSLLVGPNSSVGELAEGTWLVHVRRADAQFLAGPFVITGGSAAPPASGYPSEWYRQLAANPDEIAVGPITRDGNGAAIGFAVSWPDGAVGVFVGTPSVVASAIGAIDAYTVTYAPVGGAVVTYTQPMLTRDATTGAVTVRPAIVVS